MSIVLPPRRDTTVWVGERVPLRFVATDAAGDTVSVALFGWNSSDPGVAAVGPDGVVTAQSPGAAVITATVDSLSAQLTLAVRERLRIQSFPPRLDLVEGQSAPLEVRVVGASDDIMEPGEAGVTVTPTARGRVRYDAGRGAVVAVSAGDDTLTLSRRGATPTRVPVRVAARPRVATPPAAVVPTVADVAPLADAVVRAMTGGRAAELRGLFTAGGRALSPAEQKLLDRVRGNTVKSARRGEPTVATEAGRAVMTFPVDYRWWRFIGSGGETARFRAALEQRAGQWRIAALAIAR